MRLSRRKGLLLAAAAIILPRSSRAFFRGGYASNPWINLDGRLNAPAGSAQFPSLLNGYPAASPPNARTQWPINGTQPPWDVAGVDYAVGIPSGTVLTNPASLSMAGVTVDAVNCQLTITADNITLSNLDLSLGGIGWLILIHANNFTLTNSKWAATTAANASVALQQISGSGVTITYCDFNANGVLPPFAGEMLTPGSGNVGDWIIKYSRFRNGGVWFFYSGNSTNVIMTNNLIENFSFYTSNFHFDLFFQTGYDNITNLFFQWNTVIENSNGIYDSTGTLGVTQGGSFPYNIISAANNGSGAVRITLDLLSGALPPPTSWANVQISGATGGVPNGFFATTFISSNGSTALVDLIGSTFTSTGTALIIYYSVNTNTDFSFNTVVTANAQVQIATSAGTATGSNVLHFTPGPTNPVTGIAAMDSVVQQTLAAGQRLPVVTNLTHPSTIPANTTATNSTNGTITLSNNVASGGIGGVQSGDVINFSYSSMSHMFITNKDQSVNPVTLTQNYVDQTGMNGTWLTQSLNNRGPSGPFTAPAVTTNNVNMIDGTTLS